MARDVLSRQFADLFARSGWPASGQQLISNRSQRKDVGRCAPLFACNALGRTVWSAYGGAHTYTLQRFDDAEAAGARLIGGYKNVTQVEAAVANTAGSREIDCASELRQERQRLIE